jgi:hypothetical protein
MSTRMVHFHTLTRQEQAQAIHRLAREDKHIGRPGEWISNTFVVQRRARHRGRRALSSFGVKVGSTPSRSSRNERASRGK